MKTLRTGLIGDHISKSRFCDALELICSDHAIKLEFEIIDTADRKGVDFTEIVDGLRKLGWDGVSVTHPHKPAAALYPDTGSSEISTRLGAANTLTFSPRPAGHNTDYLGFIAAWRALMGAHRRPGRVAMAGAGGVARALGPALAELGADEITIWDQSPDLAKDLANRIGPKARAIDIADAPRAIAAANGLVNATPMGMAHAPGTAFDPDLIGGQDWAFDAVYTPIDTEFLKRSKDAGLTLLSGFDFFRFMAIKSFEVYTGLSPDPDKTLRALNTLKPSEVAA